MDTLTASLVAVHIVISIALIGLVLLNSGKGGGLSDMLGGPGASGNIGQTLAERNLSRITAVVALLFSVTTLLLFWFLD
ncbi:MAG: preprotein translocase subunit SecG [Candidatus Actinomarina sp.]|jgi:preprotein translocase subunit SecG|nr:preprotein translocase subunit SecG [Acidimicrobiaceae bacterium]MDB4604604.1 preprotein translocase subunit SecG [Acidimicrobiia bacterium]MDC0977910.1 preprotein translocase subunit SecG [Acidimicrobiia bacterium]RPH01858.1 MAG: preprotein translocase subunit SecG [bacterium TMED221]|tara:strand:+ start:16219 stop:16455 length:237 start_codon:yes stop_codon:yes gene_type:complete